MRKGLTVLTVTVAMTLVAFAATVQNVAGTISEPATGEPVEGLQVSFYDAVNAELLASATTDASGHYDTGNLPAGNYRVRFSMAPPYMPRYLGPDGTDSFCGGTIVSVVESTTTVLDADVPSNKEGDGGGAIEEEDPTKVAGDGGGGLLDEIAPGADSGVAGTVVDSDTGAPLPGIRVTLLRAGNATQVATGTTGPDGTWSFDSEDLPAGSVRVRFTDPSGAYAQEFYGAEADVFCTATIVHVGLNDAVDVSLEKVPPAQLTQQLEDTVEDYGLSPAVETLLGTSLTQVRKLLADDHPGNDSAACGQLASFVNRVDVQERKGELTAVQANELKSMSTNVRSSLGCQ